MQEIPKSVIAYKKTAEFDESTIPQGLLNAHQTKAGVWAKIVILEGQLQYTINTLATEVVILTTSIYGVVEPETLHEVKALGKVRFYVEFYK